jgi:8-amino-7-oxononanoate synthase
MKKPVSTLSNKLKQRKEAGLLRTLRLPENLVDFTSNDYLGLASEPLLKERIAHSFSPIKENGSTGSRLLTGNKSYHTYAETFLAEHFESPDALSFPSGYMANLALFSALPQKGDVVLYDEYIHACVKDGIRLSFADKKSFRHNDLGDLQRLLERYASSTCYVAVESVYSMLGDSAPLRDLAALCNRYHAHLIVDEAHSTGVMGPHGKGACIGAGITSDCLAIIYTFGKGMGVHGAVLACSPELKDFLINFSRPFIYTTAVDAHTLIGMVESIRLLNEQAWRIQRLQENVAYFQKQMVAKTNIRPSSQHAIQPLKIAGNHAVKAASELLRKQGYDIRPITSPTVPVGEECLRVVLHTFQKSTEIDELSDILGQMPPFMRS